ncbi:MAG: hypothetical protein JW892_00515 [Anaerolineae bacterium]|nr:hypothetical protein [Anaerolineae bacterium]
MKKRLGLWIGFLGLLAMLALGEKALAGPPGLPHWLWGTVTLDGLLVDDGTPVQMLTQGVNVITTTVLTAGSDAGLYSVGVPADDPDRPGVQGGVNGTLIEFGISGYEIGQTVTWTQGQVLRRDLHNGPFTYTFVDTINGESDSVFPAHDGNPGLIINANGVDLGATSLQINANQECVNAQNAVHRCFQINPTNAAGRNATVTFFFYSSQIPVGHSCEAMNAYHWNGSSWQLLAAELRDCEHDPHSLRVSDVTDFSQFVLADTIPAAVTLLTFLGIPEEGAISITWETATELDNLGFNLYRSEIPFGPWGQLNPELIPAQYPGSILGAVYEWLDTDVIPANAYYYRLEAIDIHGVSTFYGPISVTATDPAAVTLLDFGSFSGLTPLVPGLILLSGVLLLLFARWKGNCLNCHRKV